MRICNFFLFLTTAHVRMHHLADDGARANDGDLHDEVVELLRPIFRQGGFLCLALDLKHANRVCSLQRPIDLFILGQLCEIEGFAIVLRNKGQAILEHGHHAKPQEIHFDDAEVGTVLFVPLHHRSPWHRGTFQRHNFIELALADHHAARMLAEMSREVLNPHTQLQVLRDTWMLYIEPGVLERARHRIVRPLPLIVRDEAR